MVRFKKAFTEDLQQRQKNCNFAWLSIATALDPRFKHLKCLSKEKREEIWIELKDLLKTIEGQNNETGKPFNFYSTCWITNFVSFIRYCC